LKRKINQNKEETKNLKGHACKYPFQIFFLSKWPFWYIWKLQTHF